MRALIVAALVATAVPGAHAGDFRREFGVVSSPVPVVNGRPLAQLTLCTPNEQAQGTFGVVFELTEPEGDGAHMFLARDAQMGMTPPPTDVDVTFFTDIGSCDPATFRLPSPAEPPVFAGPGNETGMVPPGMRYLVVTAKNGLVSAVEIRLWS